GGSLALTIGPPLKSNPPATMQTMAPTTKAPMTVGLIVLPMMYSSPCRPGRECPGPASRRGVHASAPEEGPNLRLRRGVSQGRGRPYRQHGFRVCVEEDAVVANGKNARQLVGHHHDRGAKAVPELQNQVVQPA